MARGGARANSGPAPDPDAIRRERPSDQAGWVTLPTAREGEVPAWPLGRTSRREAALWSAAWALPQALMWERANQHHEVAVHVRTAARAERPGATSALLTAYRQQREDLGLSQTGLARRRWRIGGTPEATRQEATSDGGSRTSASSRFKGLTVIDGESG